MMIDKIAGINQINNLQNTKHLRTALSVATGVDEISISDEAKEMLEAQKLNAIAKETPDVRMDRIAAVREKLKDPNYFSAATIAATADQVMSAYGL